MYEDEKIIETIKSGQLPKIQTDQSEVYNGLEISQRGLEITNYELNNNKKTKDKD